ncbi:hypothetical protein MCAMS1_00443 [biofilm metagenome]
MFEKAWYELSPMVYSVISCIIMFNTNHLAFFFAFLLFLTSLLIGVMRLQSRINPKTKIKKVKSKSAYRISRL